jgi:hypothetical protein
MPVNPPSPDPELEAVRRAILRLDPDGAQIGHVLRDTIDQLLDGVHTGRYRWSELYKTEKTHAGTLVEINLQRRFRDTFLDGKILDYLIEGVEVDCKFSQTMSGWMIPPEATDHLCLLVWASDDESKWSAGLVRAREEHLSSGTNRDRKRTLSKAGRVAIRWLFQDAALPQNVFLRLRLQQVEDILAPEKSGQQRVNRLFTHAQQQIISRAAVATAAQQDDFMKRVRENGGAREKLRPFGIAILGHEHQQLARDLGLDSVPDKGEFVSVRLVSVPKRTQRKTAVIAGKQWAVALPGEPVEPAPVLPRSKPDRSS